MENLNLGRLGRIDDPNHLIQPVTIKDDGSIVVLPSGNDVLRGGEATLRCPPQLYQTTTPCFRRHRFEKLSEIHASTALSTNGNGSGTPQRNQQAAKQGSHREGSGKSLHSVA